MHSSRRRFFGSIAAATMLCGPVESVATELFRFDGTAGFDRLGQAVASGDINGDGRPDFIVGAPRVNANAAGSVFVFSGLDGSELLRFDGLNAGDSFGITVSSAGDLNGDSRDDILVGAPFTNIGGLTNAGSVFAFSGADGSQLFRVDGDLNTLTLGGAVASTGDVNGDGIPDIVAGAAAASPGPTAVGSVLVLSGAGGARLLRIDGTVTGENFGELVAGAGDVNGDGTPDILVGLPKASPGALVHRGQRFRLFRSGRQRTLPRRWSDRVRRLRQLGSRGW